MFRSSLVYLQSFQPELHRYAQATFHEGTHRQAPGDSTPWRDVSSPLNRIRGWWLAPAAKGSMLAAWCITLVLGTYCYSIQQDAKGTYLLNNALLRNLHSETQRADANEVRANQLEKSIEAFVSKEKERKGTMQSLKSYITGSEKLKEGLVNYDLEVTRQRMRADEEHHRNEELLKELAKLRRENAALLKDNKTLATEINRVKQEEMRLRQ